MSRNYCSLSDAPAEIDDLWVADSLVQASPRRQPALWNGDNSSVHPLGFDCIRQRRARLRCTAGDNVVVDVVAAAAVDCDDVIDGSTSCVVTAVVAIGDDDDDASAAVEEPTADSDDTSFVGVLSELIVAFVDGNIA